MVSRKDIQSFIQTKLDLQHLIDKAITLTILYGECKKLSLTTIFKGVSIGSTTDMINAPPKRIDTATGKQYTPRCILLEFLHGGIYIVYEDIEDIYHLVGSITIKVHGVEVRIEC